MIPTFTDYERLSTMNHNETVQSKIRDVFPNAVFGPIHEDIGMTKFTVDNGGIEFPSDLLLQIHPSRIHVETTRDGSKGHFVRVFWIKTQKRKIYEFKRECDALFYFAVTLVSVGLAALVFGDDVRIF